MVMSMAATKQKLRASRNFEAASFLEGGEGLQDAT
jgi:hypothetical protein